MVFVDVLIAVVIALLIVLLIMWFVHIQMVKGYTSVYGYASYKSFKREFNKRNWHLGFMNSIDSSSSQIHADIIKFDGLGMIMRNPFSYLLYKLHIWLFIKTKRKVERVKW